MTTLTDKTMDTIVTNNREAFEDFVDEALNSLSGLPASLEAYRENPAETEPIHAVFRAVHSIKGCAAFLDLDAIRDFSHSLENTLDAVRSGHVNVTDDLVRAFIAAFDLLSGMLQDVAEGTIVDELGPPEQELLDRVRQLAAACSAEKDPEELLCEQILAFADSLSGDEMENSSQWARRLKELVQSFTAGRSSHTTPTTDASDEVGESNAPLCSPADLLEAHCMCGELDVTEQIHRLAETLLACEDRNHAEQAEAELLWSIESLAAWAWEANQPTLAESLAAAASDLKTVLDSPVDLDANLLSLIWDHFAAEVGKLRVRPTARATDHVPPAASKNDGDSANRSPVAKQKQPTSRFVRVKEERLDDFLEHVSRLFITVELFKDVQTRMAKTGQLPELAEEIRQINTDLGAESRAVQQGVMALRRVAVSGLFSKFPRMARGLALNLGKKIAVHTSGEDTEIEKTLSEDLDAPLTHLVRNVVDHGIETPEVRTARGVSATGNLWLSARQTKNHVQITVRDDGRGIDSDMLREKAVDKGLLSQSQAATLSDKEALNLIFHPGFSMAEKVSEVSGRGVGMDVVRTTLEKHGGQVAVDSQVGSGTTLRLDIPIQQATLVIDGLMVGESDERFVIPFENIREIVEVSPEQFYSVHGGRMARVRDEVFQAVRLSEVLNLSSTDAAPERCLQGVLVYSQERTLCLLVSRILGHRQVVVSSLQETLLDTDKMAGVAQLGGGHLALVLNVTEMIRGTHEV